MSILELAEIISFVTQIFRFRGKNLNIFTSSIPSKDVYWALLMCRALFWVLENRGIIPCPYRASTGGDRHTNKTGMGDRNSAKGERTVSGPRTLHCLWWSVGPTDIKWSHPLHIVADCAVVTTSTVSVTVRKCLPTPIGKVVHRMSQRAEWLFSRLTDLIRARAEDLLTGYNYNYGIHSNVYWMMVYIRHCGG